MIDLSNTEVDLPKSTDIKIFQRSADVSLSFSLPINSRVINLPHPFWSVASVLNLRLVERPISWPLFHDTFHRPRPAGIWGAAIG